MEIRNALCVLLCTLLCSVIQGQGFQSGYQQDTISVLCKNKQTGSSVELSCLDCCDVCKLGECPTTPSPIKKSQKNEQECPTTPSPKNNILTAMVLQKYNFIKDCPTTPSPVKKSKKQSAYDCPTSKTPPSPKKSTDGLIDSDSDSEWLDVGEDTIGRAQSFSVFQ